jgi:hypothetical protein
MVNYVDDKKNMHHWYINNYIDDKNICTWSLDAFTLSVRDCSVESTNTMLAI